ncbi:MAG TPA: sulfatase-like hydrolase/transferase [Thermoanaerobaculia bacterium]|nr:sulfatase-like hydrolase/transferase [Thermoanaerobaculia bacterium]
MIRFARCLVIGALAGMTLLGTGCGGRTRSWPGAPVVILSIDTLRSDRLAAYGNTTIETPAISALAKDSILFERAYSHYPLTLPSHVSMLTGLLPPEHGVRDNVGYPFAAERHPFLPRLLHEAGYRTGAAVSAFVLHGDTGLAKGFDFYEDSIQARKDTPLGGLQRKGEETLRLGLSWLDQGGQDRTFLFLHVYEPHTPYLPPEPFRSRYSHPYDGEVAYADTLVGRLVGALKQRKLYDRALLIVLSDHGEGLGDHGEEEHGIFLYRESLQVPLLVKLPGGSRGGERVSMPAQLADVMPTVLASVGVDVPAGLAGRPLTGLGPNDAGRGVYSETFYPRLHMGWSDLASLIGDRFQYIDAPDPELYDLLADSAQKNNVLSTEKRAFVTLRQQLHPLRKPLAKPSEVDPETQAKLAALGYAGAPVLFAEGPLPDPKAQIGALADLKEATRLMGLDRFHDAVPLLRRMVERNPRMQDAWDKLSIALVRAGRRTEAVEVYQKALENSGGSPWIALSLAALLAELGRYQEARAHAELALTSSPAKARQQLAEIAMLAEDFSEAQRQATELTRTQPEKVESWVVLARILARQGKLAEARSAFTQAETRQQKETLPPPTGYFLVRGDVEAREGRLEEAVRSFEEEIRANPDRLDAFSRLALVLVEAGQPDQAVATLRRMVDQNGGSPAAYASAVETLQVLGDRQSAARLLAYARGLYPDDPQLKKLGAG